jgi:hypothetical protein
MARLGMNKLVVQLSAHARSAWDTEDRFRAMAATGEISVPSAAGVPSGASVGVRPAASRRRVQGRGCPFRVDSSPSRREGSAVEDGSTAPQQHGRRLSFAKLTLVKASAAGMNVGMLALPDVRLAATTDRIRCKALAMRRSSRRASGTHCGLPGVWFCRAWVVPGTGRRT